TANAPPLWGEDAGGTRLRRLPAEFESVLAAGPHGTRPDGNEHEIGPCAAWPPGAHRMDRRAITISGIVQGVGFRPLTYRLASRLGLQGCIRNCNGGVLIEVEGEPHSLD